MLEPSSADCWIRVENARASSSPSRSPKCSSASVMVRPARISRLVMWMLAHSKAGGRDLRAAKPWGGPAAVAGGLVLGGVAERPLDGLGAGLPQRVLVVGMVVAIILVDPAGAPLDQAACVHRRHQPECQHRR